MKKALLFMVFIFMVAYFTGCLPNKPVITYDTLDKLKADVEFYDFVNPLKFFVNKEIVKLSEEKKLDITANPNDRENCWINFESKGMHIQITRYTNMEYSISSLQNNYQKGVIRDINFEYFFEESEEQVLNFGFEYQGSYYLFIVKTDERKSNRELIEIMYQYMNTL